MENKDEQIFRGLGSKKRGSLKWKVYLVLFIIVLGIVAYGYFWYAKTSDLRIKAEQVIGQEQKFEVLQNAIKDESARCEQFISQEEGDFGSFEYCQKFLDWAKNNGAQQ
jgi:hypothetical protein